MAGSSDSKWNNPFDEVVDNTKSIYFSYYIPPLDIQMIALVLRSNQNLNMKSNIPSLLLVGVIILLFTRCNADGSSSNHFMDDIPLDSIRAIAKDAYIYGFPMVEAYRIQYAYFVDAESPEFKYPYNRLKNIPRVYTANDKAVQTPNSDTPYSIVGLDLRTEPLIMAVPYIDGDRYFSIQIIDSYTHNIGYFGSRTTGTDDAIYLVAGPNWDGEVPFGISKVIRTETDLAMAIYRTQLYNVSDLDIVRKIQKRFIIRPLSQYAAAKSPTPAPAIEFIKPLSTQQVKSSIEVFNILNFTLKFCPVNASEKELMKRFAKIGIGPGLTIDTAALSKDVRKALQQGIQDAWDIDFAGLKKKIDAGQVLPGKFFGDRAYLKNNYLYRMAGAVLGIFGNSREEAIYPVYSVDADDSLLDASTNNYTIHFSPEEIPPVNAFWSLTMYELPSSLLTANPLDRYLLNSSMMDQFIKDAHGGMTFYLQHESPGKDKEANWLPAPSGPFMAVLRLYWPKEAALDGSWKKPAIISNN